MSSTEYPVAAEIHRRIMVALCPTVLTVTDESDKHRGHMGHREGVETHFNLHAVSASFAGKSRVERQRLVHGLLADLMDGSSTGPIHALSLKLETP